VYKPAFSKLLIRKKELQQVMITGTGIEETETYFYFLGPTFLDRRQFRT